MKAGCLLESLSDSGPKRVVVAPYWSSQILRLYQQLKLVFYVKFKGFENKKTKRMTGLV